MAGFEENIDDTYEHFPCDCGKGSVRFYENTGCWECDKCDFKRDGKTKNVGHMDLDKEK